jgi:hypothetical protein
VLERPQRSTVNATCGVDCLEEDVGRSSYDLPMADSRDGDQLVVRLLPRQRVTQLAGAILFGGIGLGLTLLGPRSAPGRGVTLSGAAICIPVALWLLNIQAGRTTVDADSVQAGVRCVAERSDGRTSRTSAIARSATGEQTATSASTSPTATRLLYRPRWTPPTVMIRVSKRFLP